MANRNVTCRIKLFRPVVRQLSGSIAPALEKTAEALHKEVVQSQKMPFDKGTLQNESTFVDNSEAKNGTVYLVSSTPYARRLYYHPEYHFNREENPNAGGRWLADYLPGGNKEDFAQEAFNRFYAQEADI